MEILNSIWGKIADIKGKSDFKLQQLIGMIENKVQHPINTDNKKVIIFTAFADTANYLYENIQLFVYLDYKVMNLIMYYYIQCVLYSDNL